MALSSIQLEAFLAVAQTLNFTRAAESLHVTQSALSQRIMNLERELECSLFIRDRSGLRLTDVAQELVRYCRCKNSLEEEFLSDLTGKESGGVIRVGGFSSVMQSVILKSLTELLTTIPKLKLHMVVDEITKLPKRLESGEIDYVILDHRQQKEGLERIALGKEKNVLVQVRKYRGPEVFLDHDESDRVTSDYLKLIGQKNKSVERRYLDNVYGLIEGVRLGLGRAVLPKHLIGDSREFEILNPDIVLEIPVFLYFYTQPYYSKLHTKIIEAITKNSPLILT